MNFNEWICFFVPLSQSLTHKLALINFCKYCEDLPNIPKFTKSTFLS